MSADNAAVLVAKLRGLKGIADLHQRSQLEMEQSAARYAALASICQPQGYAYRVRDFIKRSFAFGGRPLLLTV